MSLENTTLAVQTTVISGLAACIPTVSAVVNPLAVAGFTAASYLIDQVAGKCFHAEGRKNPTANSNKQMARYAITVLGGIACMGFVATAAAFMLNQGAIMLANRCNQLLNPVLQAPKNKLKEM